MDAAMQVAHSLLISFTGAILVFAGVLLYTCFKRER